MHAVAQKKQSESASNLHGGVIIQPKLKVNTPGDKYEREADAMADKVMRMKDTGTGFTSKSPHNTRSMVYPTIQRKCSKCAEEEKKKKKGPIMRKASGEGGFEAPSGFASQLSASQGNGKPLPDSTRNFMENAFSSDFSNVRIHTGSKASEMNSSINAKAFTYGNDIYFNRGKYSPKSVSGKKLLAHELTHVGQQNERINRYISDQSLLAKSNLAAINENKSESFKKTVSRGEKLDKLRELLRNDEESKSINLIGLLNYDEAKVLIYDREMRKLMIDSFNDGEMYQAMFKLSAPLVYRLDLMFREGTNWGYVKSLLKYSEFESNQGQKSALYESDIIKKRFVKLCDDETMAEAVDIIGGNLIQKLIWMMAEGSNWRLVREKIRKETDYRYKLFLYSDELDPIKKFFIKICNDIEMAEAVDLIGGSLLQKFLWMKSEGSNWSLIERKLIIADTKEKVNLYDHKEMRQFFIKTCSDKEMAQAVKLLGGTLSQKLNWMVGEGTNSSLVLNVLSTATIIEKQEILSDQYIIDGLEKKIGYLGFVLVKNKLKEAFHSDYLFNEKKSIIETTSISDELDASRNVDLVSINKEEDRTLSIEQFLWSLSLSKTDIDSDIISKLDWNNVIEFELKIINRFLSRGGLRKKLNKIYQDQIINFLNLSLRFNKLNYIVLALSSNSDLWTKLLKRLSKENRNKVIGILSIGTPKDLQAHSSILVSQIHMDNDILYLRKNYKKLAFNGGLQRKVVRIFEKWYDLDVETGGEGALFTQFAKKVWREDVTYTSWWVDQQTNLLDEIKRRLLGDYRENLDNLIGKSNASRFVKDAPPKLESFGGVLWEDVKSGQAAKNIAYGAKGMAVGAYGAVKGTLEFGYQIVTDPKQAWEDLKNIPAAMEALWKNREELLKMFDNASPEEQAEMIGKLFGEIQVAIAGGAATTWTKGRLIQAASSPKWTGRLATIINEGTKLPSAATGKVLQVAKTVVKKGGRWAVQGAKFVANGIYHMGGKVLRGTWNVVETVVNAIKKNVYYFYDQTKQFLMQISENIARLYVRCSKCKLTGRAKEVTVKDNITKIPPSKKGSRTRQQTHVDDHVELPEGTHRVSDIGVKKSERWGQIINKHLAGEKHPISEVPFDMDGYPIFKSKYNSELPENMRGPTTGDPDQFMVATADLRKRIHDNPNLEKGFTEKQLQDIKELKEKIDGLTWHHHQDGKTLQLVDSKKHHQTGHTGGRSTVGGRNGDL